MAGDEHVTEATSGNTRFVQHNGLCLALLEVRILCYKQEVKSSVSITRGPAVCQTFCWAWGGAGSSGSWRLAPQGRGASLPLPVGPRCWKSRLTSRLVVGSVAASTARVASVTVSHATEPWHVPSCGVPAEGDQHTLAERVRLALVLPGSSRRTFSFSVAGAAARPAGGQLPDSCLLAAPGAVLAVCPPRGGDSPLPLVFMPFRVTPRPRPDVQGGSPLGPAPRSSPSEDRSRLAGSCFPRPSSPSPSPR